MYPLNIALSTAVLNRVETNYLLESLLVKHKSVKGLMESKPNKEIVEACEKLITPAMKEIERQFARTVCDNKKVKLFPPATNDNMVEEMSWLQKKIPFLPKNIETCKPDIFRKSKEGMEFMKAYFRSNTCTW